MTRSFPLLLSALLLTACTGTEDATPSLRLAVLTSGGATVRTVTLDGSDGSTSPEGTPVTVTGGVDLDTLPVGNRLALTLSTGIESRSAGLSDVQAFAPPFGAEGFTSPCLKATVLNAQRDRLLTLSQCDTPGTTNGPQQLALYRTSGTLVWRAALPTPFLVTGPDVPPVRIALVRENGVDVGVVSRPALGGGSEVMRAAATTTGAERADVSTPFPTVNIRDLAPALGGSAVYAATDTGVQPLTSVGVPNPQAALSAFGSERVDRLWTSVGSGVGGGLIAAWRDAGSGVSSSLRLWDVADTARTAAANVGLISDLRDVTFAPDGRLYALTRTSLTSYDTLLGLRQGNWQLTSVLSNLNEAQAVAWVVPPVEPAR
ncbi:hypothetical protein [Deinococcus hopiensis]|uniref:Lipoprotein n=1 Tax=Deinococcus hopiensis KR-140 TaxID=695939 RepID=A0A1W1VBD6_9DEIO|nr:hypothetical protein [Deinococcus hopiensis]SMB90500.1 hypothetical protein SAMN00790413_00794 [Deinococcus hopiensis KR-140]